MFLPVHPSPPQQSHPSAGFPSAPSPSSPCSGRLASCLLLLLMLLHDRIQLRKDCVIEEVIVVLVHIYHVLLISSVLNALSRPRSLLPEKPRADPRGISAWRFGAWAFLGCLFRWADVKPPGVVLAACSRGGHPRGTGCPDRATTKARSASARSASGTGESQGRRRLVWAVVSPPALRSPLFRPPDPTRGAEAMGPAHQLGTPCSSSQLMSAIAPRRATYGSTIKP